MTQDTAISRVARGAALLDAKCPGWAKEIDLEMFSIESKCNCVLGQIYGNYAHAIEHEGLKLEEFSSRVEHGFVPEGQKDAWPVESAWRAEIERRVGNDGDRP